MNPRRRNQTFQPAAKAIADQFTKDRDQSSINLGEYKLISEYGVTKS
jgi:hypothetical protein